MSFLFSVSVLLPTCIFPFCQENEMSSFWELGSRLEKLTYSMSLSQELIKN